MTAVAPAFVQTLPQPAAPSGARASQAAFFRAALTGAGLTGAAPVPPVSPVAAAAPTTRSAPDETAFNRPSRPGALLDIRV